MDNTRLRRYLLSMHGQDTVGIMYNITDGRLINVTSKELAASALEAAEEALGMKDAAWISCDTLKRTEDGDVMISTEKTMPEEYYQDGYDFLLVVSDKSGSEEKGKEKVQEIQTFLQTWNLNISEVITYKSAFYLVFKTENMRKDNALHMTAVRKLIQILRYTYTDDNTTVKGTDRRCCMYPLPGTPGADMIPELFNSTKNAYEYIAAFVAARYPEMQQAMEWNKFKPENFNMRDFLKSHNVFVYQEDEIDGARRYFVSCPFEQGIVTNGTVERMATIIQHKTGEISYICTTCKYPHTWDDFRKAIAPTPEEREQMEVEKKMHRKKKAVDPKNFGKTYQETNALDAMDMLYIWENDGDDVYVPTGLTQLDKVAGGLGREMLSIVYGLSGAGKSTLLTEIMLNAIDAGYRAGMISKELSAKRCIGWSYLIAAGDQNLQTVSGQTYTPHVVVKKIAAWQQGKMYIDYNKTSETNASKLLKIVEKQIRTLNLDLYIIDNLMMLDLGEYAEYQSEYAAQSRFMQALHKLAEDTECHIILCTHPRKPDGIVRLDDIKGSSDIRGIADQIFIIHKVDDDFERLQKAYFHWKTGEEVKSKSKNKDTGEEVIEYYPRDPRLCASSLVEIAKNRYSGKTDIFVPLYYDEKSKRLRNAPGEVKHYGWEDFDPSKV